MVFVNFEDLRTTNPIRWYLVSPWLRSLFKIACDDIRFSDKYQILATIHYILQFINSQHDISVYFRVFDDKKLIRML